MSVVPPIGVMLPARLETVFVPPAEPGAPWRLRVAVIPDEVWSDHHDPRVSAHELGRLEAMWRACAGNLADPERGRAAFRRLAAEVGPGRAAWLARTFPPLRDPAGNVDLNAPHVIDWDAAQAQLRPAGEKAPASRLAPLPPAIEVWLGYADGRLERLQPPLTPDPAAPGMAETMEAHRGLFWLEGGEPHSWFEDAGLTAILDLPFTEEAELAEIAFLAAVGISDVDPVALFQSHRDAGRLAVIPLGTATNTVGGEPAVDLGHDAWAWRRLVIHGSRDPAAATDLSMALGDIQPVPGDAGGHRGLGQSLVRSLWAALWGHALKDIWNLRHEPAPFPHYLGLWAGDYLDPEGPLPPIRIGDQPYGLLPTTALALWHHSGDGPVSDVEILLAPLAQQWRARLAEQVRGKGNVVDATTDRLLDLISRTPSASQYAFREFLPLHLIHALAAALQGQVDLRELRAQWEQLAGDPARELLQIEPLRRYATWGWPRVLEIPLVEPPPLSMEDEEALAQGVTLFSTWLRRFYEHADTPDHGIQGLLYGEEYWQPYPPNSLLLRLLVHALLVATAELQRLPVEGPLIELLLRDDYQTEVESLLRAGHALTISAVMDDSQVGAHVLGTPQLALVRNAIVALGDLIGLGADQTGVTAVERAFRATLDTAALRVDPWITGMAWRRLQRMRSDGAGAVLGLYAWVDAPYRGEPGPTEGGLLHAPSDAQARTAVILRDRAFRDPQPDRWQIDLTSRKVRLAKQFADEVRAGSHIQEVLGRAVERVIANRERIAALRSEMPIRTEHAGRRVCDGQRVLAEKTDAQLRALVGLDEDRFGALKELQEVVDGYADLLVVNAVHQVVSRRPEAAGATMDAAASLALPPELDALRTPRRGRSVTTTVWLVLPHVTPPSADDPEASPAALAEPAFAAYLAAQLPPADWIWHFEGQPVTLAELGLTPVDALVLPADMLIRLVTQGRGGEEPAPTSPAMALLARARRLAAAFFGHPLSEGADELAERFDTVHAAATRLAGELKAAADDDARLLALRRAARWGLVPPIEIPDEPPEHRTRRAAESLAERIAHSPFPRGSQAIATALDDELRPQQPDAMRLQAAIDAAAPFIALAPLDGETTEQLARRTLQALRDRGAIEQRSASDAARAIAALAAPGGVLPIFGRVARSALDVLRGVDGASGEAEEVPSPLQPREALDREWLEVVAAVRPAMARLEGHQLEALAGGTKLDAWANRPPWELESAAGDVTRPTHLHVAYGPAGALQADPSETIPAIILDGWAETVPGIDHTTTAAFGFNAPGARAPQAILLAVPPDPTTPLNVATLAQIVAETRELAHARMATTAELGRLAGVMPLATWLPATYPSGVLLDPVGQ